MGVIKTGNIIMRSTSNGKQKEKKNKINKQTNRDFSKYFSRQEELIAWSGRRPFKLASR